ncbi:MAG: FlgD immunoglobulin-like domain containing protein, partial [Candidatus Eisenbacteria bacterium]
GDLPGVEGGRFSNVNLGSFPNPAFAGRNVTLKFTLAKKQDVTVRIYNVAGREVARIAKLGDEGLNTIIWNGELANGAKATAGVYFYAVDGIDFVKESSKAQKMILLSAN